MKVFRKALPPRPAAPLPSSPVPAATTSSKCGECENEQAVKYCQQCDVRLCSGCDRTVHASRVTSAHVRVDVDAKAAAASSLLEKKNAPVSPQVDKATAAKWVAEAYARLEEITRLEADLGSCGKVAKEALDQYFDELGRAVTNRRQELEHELSTWLRDRQAALSEAKRKATQVANGHQSGPVPQVERGQGVGFSSASGGSDNLQSAIRASGRLAYGSLGTGGVMKPPARDYASIKGPKLRVGLGRGDAPGEMICPIDIAVHPTTGDAYVVDMANHRVQVFNSDGQVIRSFGKEGEGSLAMPRNVVFDRDGNVVVSDARNRLTVWSTDGKFLRYVVGTPALSKGVDTIKGVALHPGTGNYMIVDSRNYRVQTWRPDGALVSAFSFEPCGDDIAVDSMGNYLIPSSFPTGRIMVYSPKGQLLRSFGAVMPGDTEEFKPASVDVDAAGNILVADEGNHRIQVWSPDFELLCAFGTPGTDTPDQLRDPHCVTVAPNGDVLVSVGLTNLCLVF